MISNLSHVMTLANSIIGVSVLAMPFCFKQCGIVLAMLVLLVSSVLSRLACHFLIKSAVMSRRRNFEFLAFHAFGRTGKFLVELFIIGFLVGTCIAFFVVVGDLGPQIVGKMLNKRPEDIRTSLLVTTGTFIVFPLGLLRNIDSLSSVCTATIGFYLCLVVKVIAESARHIFLGDWYDRVMYWRPAGILQCLPIFAMALFCQTQLFEIYEAIPNVCLEKMNRVVRGALNICTIVYLCVGFFGYVAFCTQPFTGNILMSFEPSLTSDLIKMGFVFSVAFSFPLVIFPCRASLNSLLFRRAHTHEPSNYYIPEMRFRCLTLTIVALSLGTGILIPNIEFVLGIVGSTIGVMICLIFPAAFFIAISTKNTNERLIAQAILFFGMWIMVLGTYANLYAMEESSSARLFVTTDKPLYRINDVITLNGIPREGFLPIRQLPKDVQINQEPNEGNLEMPQQQLHKDSKDNNEAIDVRREPPIPVERSIMTEKSPIETRNLGSNLVEASTAKILESNAKMKNGQADVAAAKIPKPQEAENAVVGVEKRDENKRLVDERKENLIDSDAIKKEESELAAAGNLADVESAAKFEKLQQTLEKHKLEQMKMMQEQKEILKDIKEQKQELQMEKKRLAEEQRKKNIDAREERINKVETIIEEKPSIVRSNHGNNHQVNDVDHRSIESLNEKDKMPDKSSNQRNNHGNDLQLDKVDNRLIETQNVVDKSLEKSSNLRNNHQVDQEDRLSVDGQKENDKPPEKSSVNEENVQRSVINQQEIPNSNNLESPLVESDKSRGPILNALTNWTSKRNSSIKEENRDAKIVEPLPKKREFALPIALQLRNQTKESPEKKLINASNADSETLAIQRDILDRADRLKREATENSNEVIPNVPEIPETVPEERERSVDIQRDKNDREQCRQKEEKSANFISRDETSVKTKQETSSVSPSTITIKSLVYLAEQRFTDEILAPDPNNVKIGEADLTKLKKRDLKSFNSE